MSYLVTVQVEALKNCAAIEKFCQRQSSWKLKITGQFANISTPAGHFTVNTADGSLRYDSDYRRIRGEVDKLVQNSQPTDEFNRCAFAVELEAAKIPYVEQPDGSLTIEVETPAFAADYL